MDRTRASLRFAAIFCASLAGVPACKKERAEPVDEPAPATEPGASRADPRLDPPAGEAVANPHGGGDPSAASPHGGMQGGLPGGGGGGKTPEKTAEGRVVIGPLTAAAPQSWKVRPTSSGMRAAEWTIPGKDGEAELVVYYFGAGGAGSAEANLERWVKQFEQPDGSPSTDKAKIDKKTVAGMPVTLVEVSGHYVAAVMPGATEKHDKPNHTLLGAIVETAAGPYYFKLVGPQATAAAIKKDFQAFIDSMKPSGK